jgi:hypothetical protein
MAKRFAKYYTLFLLFFTLENALIASGQVRLVPSFISCSVYIASDSASQCSVNYKTRGSNAWKEALAPVYDSLNREYRVSIVRLQEDSDYDVKVRLAGRGRDAAVFTSGFRTWTSTPPIARTIPISSFIRSEDGELLFNQLNGKPDGWIRITGDMPIHAGEKAEVAILVNRCSYLLFEGLTVTGGNRHCIKTTEHASDIRFSNCDISHWGRTPATQDIKGHFIDSDGKEINNDGGFTLYKSKNIVLERSYIHDPNGHANAWNGVVELGELKGQKYAASHPQGPNAVYVMQSGGGFILRYNDLVGSQTHRYNDPVEGWQNKDVAGGFAEDADIYGNVMAFGQDDAIELDGGQCNVRLFDNRMEQAYCGISTAPNKKGPSYIFNNVIWNLGNSLGATGNAVKNGGGIAHTTGIQYLFNNTVIHNAGGMAGVGYGSDAPENRRELYVACTRNNIFYSQLDLTNNYRKGYNISDMHRNAACSYDYDVLGNCREKGGSGAIIAVRGAEKHGVYALSSFENLDSGILTLKADDPGIHKGIPIPNFAEGIDRQAPSMGAFEYGAASTLFPMRPIDMQADKYFVVLKTGRPQQISITVGNEKSSGYRIRMNDDMNDWLQVDVSDTAVRPHTGIVLTLKATGRVPYARNGMLFLRLDNGYSIPVTVMATD